jgi:hypothetical protein
MKNGNIPPREDGGVLSQRETIQLCYLEVKTTKKHVVLKAVVLRIQRLLPLMSEAPFLACTMPHQHVCV